MITSKPSSVVTTGEVPTPALLIRTSNRVSPGSKDGHTCTRYISLFPPSCFCFHVIFLAFDSTFRITKSQRKTSHRLQHVPRSCITLARRIVCLEISPISFLRLIFFQASTFIQCACTFGYNTRLPEYNLK